MKIRLVIEREAQRKYACVCGRSYSKASDLFAHTAYVGDFPKEGQPARHAAKGAGKR